MTRLAFTLILMGLSLLGCSTAEQDDPSLCSGDCDVDEIRCADVCQLGETQCTAEGATTCELGAGGCSAWSSATRCDAGCTVGVGCEGCEDQCDRGAVQCEAGAIRSCVSLATGCRGWSDAVSCQGGACERADRCARCEDACTASSARCSAGVLQRCALDTRGCLAFVDESRCSSGTCDTDVACSCVHACEAGRSRCVDGVREQCETTGDGCTQWRKVEDCMSGVCDGPACATGCADVCAEGESLCSDGQLRRCERALDGCLAWSAGQRCRDGFCADPNQCGTCVHTCDAAGTSRCSDGALSLCESDLRGCRSFGPPSRCGEGFCADATSCGRCQHECDEGSSKCSKGMLQRCIANAAGCRRFDAATQCADGSCADARACVVCNHACREGETSCSGGQLKQCVTDAQGCRGWGAPATCADGFCADTQQCGACAHECERGASECQDGALRTCVPDANRCLAWGLAIPCVGGCKNGQACDGCAHECPRVGTRCVGGDLESCTLDADGCRRSLRRTCTGGCEGEVCRACETVTQPLLDRLFHDQSGWYRRVVFDGDRALASVDERQGTFTLRGAWLSVVDVSRPDALVPLGRISLDTQVNHMELSAAGLFLRQDLRIGRYERPVDATLSALAELTLPDGTRVEGLSVDGHRACVAATDGLHILDFSTGSPTELGVLRDIVSPRSIACKGDYAVVGGSDRLQVVDLSDLTFPQIVGDLPIPTDSHGDDVLSFDGRRIFASEYYSYSSLWWRVRGYSFTPQRGLVAGGTVDEIPLLRSMAIAGDELLIGDDQSLVIVDVSDVKNLRTVSRSILEGGAWDVQQHRGTVYVAQDGLSAYDRKRLPELHMSMSTTPQPVVRDQVVRGVLSYAAREDGLVIEDLRDPLHPVQLSRTSLTGTAIALLGDSHALVGAREPSSRASLRVFDIRNPRAPKLVGSFKINPPRASDWSRVSWIEVVGSRAYAACMSGQVCVFDLTHPEAPVLLAVPFLLTYDATTWFQGDVIYLQDGQLRAVDLADPTAPVSYPAIAIGGNQLRGGGQGTRALVAGRCNGRAELCLYRIDLSDPLHPVLGASLEVPINYLARSYELNSQVGPAHAVRVLGTRAYVTLWFGGMLVFDIEDPDRIELLGEYWTPRPVHSFAPHDRFVRVYAESPMNYPAPYAQATQVIELCK